MPEYSTPQRRIAENSGKFPHFLTRVQVQH